MRPGGATRQPAIHHRCGRLVSRRDRKLKPSFPGAAPQREGIGAGAWNAEVQGRTSRDTSRFAWRWEFRRHSRQIYLKRR